MDSFPPVSHWVVDGRFKALSLSFMSKHVYDMFVHMSVCLSLNSKINKFNLTLVFVTSHMKLFKNSFVNNTQDNNKNFL